MLKTQKGFSLIELMVVVAIIGILATIAVPNFQKFQFKAKQSEAKTFLSAIYTGEKGFKVEWDRTVGYVDVIGFTIDGTAKTYSTVGFQSHTALTSPPAGIPVGAKTKEGSGALPAACTNNATGTTFIACAIGTLDPAKSADTWTINENRIISNTVSGI
jgi:type IV pilus assembly protein PilA